MTFKWFVSSKMNAIWMLSYMNSDRRVRRFIAPMTGKSPYFFKLEYSDVRLKGPYSKCCSSRNFVTTSGVEPIGTLEAIDLRNASGSVVRTPWLARVQAAMKKMMMQATIARGLLGRPTALTNDTSQSDFSADAARLPLTVLQMNLSERFGSAAHTRSCRPSLGSLL